MLAGFTRPKQLDRDDDHRDTYYQLYFWFNVCTLVKLDFRSKINWQKTTCGKWAMLQKVTNLVFRRLYLKTVVCISEDILILTGILSGQILERFMLMQFLSQLFFILALHSESQWAWQMKPAFEKIGLIN